MRILGIDYGHKRIGLAYADELGVAVPIPAAVESSENERLEHIASEIKNRRIEKIVVGYPFNMDGTSGAIARDVDAFIETLKARFCLPVDTADERLSSFQAEHDFDMISNKRKKSVASRRRHRLSGDIDSRAIAIVLQEYMDSQ